MLMAAVRCRNSVALNDVAEHATVTALSRTMFAATTGTVETAGRIPEEVVVVAAAVLMQDGKLGLMMYYHQAEAGILAAAKTYH